MATFYKTKKISAILLAMLVAGLFGTAKAQNNLDSISPDGSVTFTTSSQYGWTATRTSRGWVARSGNAGRNSTTSSLYATVVVPQSAVDGNLSFTYRVSANSYDRLYILLDGIAIDGFSSGKSGNVPETQVDLELSAGTHTIEWYYSKSSYSPSGEDAAFISDVRFMLGYCSRPQNLMISNVTDSMAVIRWSSLAYGTSIEYDTTGFTRGTGYADFTTDSTLVITNLTPGTYYTVFLQSLCSNGDTSVWVRISFRTACEAITILPYTQDFDSWTASSSITSTIDPCWYRSNNHTTTTMYPYTYSSYFHSGRNSMYFYTPGNSVGQYSILTMPMFAENINNLAVSFWLYGYTSYHVHVGVMTDPNDPSTFTLVSDITPQASSTWCYNEVSFQSYRGSGRYIAFRTPVNGSYTYFYIDDITVDLIPDCPRPINIRASSITSTSAYISWNAVGASSWEVEYGYPGFPRGSGTRVQTSTPWYTITGLSPANSYEVYVTSNCGDTSYTRSNSFVFRTLCGRIRTMPFVENFESIATGTTSSRLPCWKSESIYSSSYPSISSSYHNSGANSLYFYSYNPRTAGSVPQYTYIATPPIDTNLFPLRTLQISFKIYRPNTSYSHQLIFGVMTDSSDVETIDTLDIIRNINYATWTDYTYTMENYRGDGRFFVLMAVPQANEYYSYPYIDDIVIDEIPRCPKPTDLELISCYDTNDVSFKWTSWPAPAQSWEIAYGPTGFSPYYQGRRITGVADTFYSISGLSPDSTYDVYVRSNCPYDTSIWNDTPITFTPGTVVMPKSGTLTYYLCDAMIYDNGGEGGNYFDGTSGTIILNPITTDSVIHISGSYNTESGYDYITVYDGVGTSGTQLARVSGAGTLSCSSTTGPLTVVFSTDIGVNMSGFALHAQCVAPPRCRRPLPTVLSVDSRRVTIDVVSSPANNWIMEFSTSSTFNTPGRGSGVTISRQSANFTINNLQPNTQYYAFICTDCGNGDTSMWSYRFSFKTPCDPVSVLPFEEDFSTMSVNAQRSCWSHHNNYPRSQYWHSSTRNKAYYFYSNTPDQPSYVAIQKFANIPISSLHVRFSLFGSDTTTKFSVGVMSNATDYSTFNPVATFNVRDDYNWYNYDIPLSSYQGSDGHLVFVANNPISATNLFFDNLVIDTASTCPEPDPDTIITSRTGATIMLPNNGIGWVLKYGPKGFDPASSAAYLFRNPNINIPGLEPNTEYDIYLRTICGAGDTSRWSLNPFTITTTCEQRQLPYTENFDRYHGTPYSEYTRAMPTCWTLVNADSPESKYRPQVFTDSTMSVNGKSVLMMCRPATVATPSLAAQLDTTSVEFFMRVDDIQTPLVVGVIEDPDYDTTFVAIDTVYNTHADVYQLHDVILSNYHGSATNIAFRTLGNNTDTMRIFIDSLVVKAIDSCPRPNNITASNILAHSVLLSWNERGTATSWIIEYDTLGFTPGTGTAVAANTNPFLLTGLDSNRTYAIYVRSVCTDTSKWATIPLEITLPRCDDGCFYTLEMRSASTGWYGGKIELRYDEHTSLSYTIDSRSGVETIAACPEEILAFSWIPGRADQLCNFIILHDADTLYASSGTPTEGFFYTTTCGSDTGCAPAINLTTNIIDYHSVNAGWYGTGTFQIACKLVGHQNYLFIDTVTTSNYVNNYVIDSLNPDSNYCWMIRHLCYIDSLSDWNLQRFRIADNLCVVPVDISISNLTNNSVDVRWTTFSNNNSWQVRCFAPSVNYDTIISTSNQRVNIGNLVSGVTYRVAVKGVCDSSAISIWSDTVMFTTQVCDTVTNVAVTNITDNSALVTWNGEGQSRWEVDYGSIGFPVGYGNTRQTTSQQYNISGLEPGTTYDVYVRNICGNNYYSVWSQRVRFRTTGNSSIVSAENAEKLIITPNPATKTATLSFDGANGETILTITDMSGRTILYEKTTCDGILQKTIDVSNFAKGSYFVHISNKTTNLVEKLIVQ